MPEVVYQIREDKHNREVSQNHEVNRGNFPSSEIVESKKKTKISNNDCNSIDKVATYPNSIGLSFSEIFVRSFNKVVTSIENYDTMEY